MKIAALTMALLTSCAGAQESPSSEVAPASSETALPAPASDPGAAPAPTISDSAPGSPAPMPPSRVNVVPSVSPDKPLADSIGTSSDDPQSFEATPATTAELAKGVAVNDPSGQPVGTIDSSTDATVVLMVGERRIEVPRNTIGKNEKGLVIGATKAELEAGADKPSKD